MHFHILAEGKNFVYLSGFSRETDPIVCVWTDWLVDFKELASMLT